MTTYETYKPIVHRYLSVTLKDCRIIIRSSSGNIELFVVKYIGSMSTTHRFYNILFRYGKLIKTPCNNYELYDKMRTNMKHFLYVPYEIENYLGLIFHKFVHPKIKTALYNNGLDIEKYHHEKSELFSTNIYVDYKTEVLIVEDTKDKSIKLF